MAHPRVAWRSLVALPVVNTEKIPGMYIVNNIDEDRNSRRERIRKEEKDR